MVSAGSLSAPLSEETSGVRSGKRTPTHFNLAGDIGEHLGRRAARGEGRDEWRRLRRSPAT